MLVQRQKSILTDYCKSYGMEAVEIYDDLPRYLVNALEAVKQQETLWCDTARFVRDYKTNLLIERRNRW